MKKKKCQEKSNIGESEEEMKMSVDEKITNVLLRVGRSFTSGGLSTLEAKHQIEACFEEKFEELKKNLEEEKIRKVFFQEMAFKNKKTIKRLRKDFRNYKQLQKAKIEKLKQ